MRLGISIPTYNESKNIVKLLQAIKDIASTLSNVNVTVVIVDDSSPDNTGKIVADFAKTSNTNRFQVVLLNRHTKDGFGKACIAGFNKLIKLGVDSVLQMDADLSHNPKYIPKLLNKAKTGADFVVASRYITGGGTPDWPLHRKLLSKYGNYYARLILNNKITDYTGGYNLYSNQLLKKINLNRISSTGYGFLIELKYKALQNSLSMAEVPLVFHDRKHGKSKIPKSTLFKNLLLVPKLRLTKSL